MCHISKKSYILEIKLCQSKKYIKNEKKNTKLSFLKKTSF